MFAKLLVTAIVVYIGYLVFRARRSDGLADAQPKRAALKPRLIIRRRRYLRLVQPVASGVLLLMVVGSGYYVYERWVERHQVVRVEIINPYTGDVQIYRAQRRDINARSFKTLEGRVVRIAETERMIVGEP